MCQAMIIHMRQVLLFASFCSWSCINQSIWAIKQQHNGYVCRWTTGYHQTYPWHAEGKILKYKPSRNRKVWSSFDYGAMLIYGSYIYDNMITMTTWPNNHHDNMITIKTWSHNHHANMTTWSPCQHDHMITITWPHNHHNNMTTQSP